MATNSALTIDSREFDAATKRFVAGIKRLPKSKKSPLVRTAQRYREFLRKALTSRPSIAQTASWLGQQWEKLEPAYTRITDGVQVPVWGGVKRAVLQGGFGAQGAHSRLGVVTRASAGGIRKGRLTDAQKAGGFRSIRLGQRFSQANVRPKLHSDGTPYRRGDKQLGKTKGRSIIGGGLKGPFEFKDNNRSLSVVWPHPAAGVHQEGRRFRIRGHLSADGTHGGGVGEIPARPFMWNPNIQRHVTAILLEEIRAYAVAIWQNRPGAR